jgi:hypothetical protein
LRAINLASRSGIESRFIHLEKSACVGLFHEFARITRIDIISDCGLVPSTHSEEF